MLGCQKVDPPVSPEINTAQETQSLENADSDSVTELEYSRSVASERSETIEKSNGEPTNIDHQPSIDDLLLFFPAIHPGGNWKPSN